MAKTNRSGRSAKASVILAKYDTFQKSAKTLLGEESGTQLLVELVRLSLDYLHATSEVVTLKSLVPFKQYFAFHHKAAPQRTSRPVNAGLFGH